MLLVLARMPPKTLTLVATFALSVLASSEAHSEPVISCSDPRGCPDLTVLAETLSEMRIQTQRFASTDCAVVEGSAVAGRRKLLRFTTTFPNWGPGDLIVGAPSAHPELFEVSSCHHHYHFKEYADYRLWTSAGYAAWRALRNSADPSVLSRTLLDSRPDIKSQMTAGAKRGFCMIDIIPMPGTDPSTARYTSCGSNQGISVGWADEYHQGLDGQWIDITDVPRGNYVLEVEVNAERMLPEVSYSNNASSVSVRIK